MGDHNQGWSACRLAGASFAVAITVTIAAPAWAQAGANTAAEANESEREGEIVVTAQFREQEIQSTPLAISAVTSEMLEQRGQTNVTEIARQVPNVTLAPQTSSWGPSLVATIRGVGQYNFNPALEPGVGLFVDDVYFATLTGSMIDLVDVERVEVLRGPQGTLTGRNSIGGAIRIVSKEPNGEDGGYILAKTGSRSLIGARGAVDFTLTDSVFVRASVASTTQHGYVERLDYGCVNPNSGYTPQRPVGSDCRLGPNLGALDSQAGRLMVRYVPTDALDILLTGDIVNEHHPGPAEVLQAHRRRPEFVCGPFCNYANYTMPDQRGGVSPNAYTWFGYSTDPNTKFDAWGVSGRIRYDLNDSMQLTSITAYREYESYWTSDGDLGPIDLVASALFTTRLEHWFFSQEVRLNGEIGPIEYTVGGFYSDQKTVLRGQSDSRPAIPLYVTNDPIAASNQALFATVLLPVTEALNITAGIRYTHDEKDYTFFRNALDGTVIDPNFNGLEADPYRASFVDYRLSVDYRWSDALMTYFTYSTGFKGGGINPLPTDIRLALPFEPERLENFEIGAKTNLFDDHVRFNVTGFYNKYHDLLLTLLSCPQFNLTFCSLITNAGDAEMKGVETELQARLGGLRVDGSFSYLDFEYTRLDPSALGITLDMVPPYVPDTKWSAGAQYEIDLGPSGMLTPRFDVSYQGSMFTNAANGPTNFVESYTLANAGITWENEPGDLSVALRVENVFDKYYVLNNFDTFAFVGSIRNVIGSPRQWSIALRKEF